MRIDPGNSLIAILMFVGGFLPMLIAWQLGLSEVWKSRRLQPSAKIGWSLVIVLFHIVAVPAFLLLRKLRLIEA